MDDDLHILTMEVVVFDRDALFAAAMKHAVEHDGLDPIEAKQLLVPGGEISPGGCLVMLLDPGHMSGCDIVETRCEAQKESNAMKTDTPDDNYVRLPKEPTIALLQALIEAEDEHNGDSINMRQADAIYRDLIRAAEKESP